jgi:competence protein ComEA
MMKYHQRIIWQWAFTAAMITIAAGCIILIGTANRQPPPLEITLPVSIHTEGSIYIGGNVSNPGYYPYAANDTVAALLAAAGGTTLPGDTPELILKVSSPIAAENLQLININRAETWLLEALPGIGEIKARAIIDYRMKHGQFTSITAITEVPGISRAIYEDIKPCITVADE